LSLKSIGAITLFVEDPQSSKTFYHHVFGMPVHFEDQNSVVFKFDNVLINLLTRQAARDLIGPAVVAGRETGSHFQFTIWVDDTDAVCLELRKRGVELLNGPVNRKWGPRTASFTDPDGYIWEIAGEPS
jgi:catechol 2,3-dioxygenase-like lactoylglutathione lyase family enzyme